MVDVPDNATTTTVLQFSSDATVGTYSGRIETLGDHDWIRVTLTAGTTYAFFLSVQRIGTSAGDAILSLRNAAGVEVAMDDESGVGANSYLQFTAVSSGTYYIDCGTFMADHTGSYSVF